MKIVMSSQNSPSMLKYFIKIVRLVLNILNYYHIITYKYMFIVILVPI